VRRGDTTVQTAIETIVKRQFVGDDEALSHEILAEGHRNPAVAQQISEFCGRYRILFRELASVANSSLAGVELDGAEEVLMACTFGLGHRKLSQARLSEAATADIAARILLRALGGAPAIFVHN
jgi:TetR/AcrR family transcriptional repressor of uid operon